jgi:SSS family solute:Na+ symporter
MLSSYSNIDLAVLILYLLVTLGIGLYHSRRSDSNTEEYFLAGKSIGWLAIGLTIFSANISSEHFIGLAGSGASKGLAVGQFELIAVFILVLLGWILAPIYLKSGVMTMPEFLEKRFDNRIRKIFAILSISIYLFTKVSVTLFAGGLLFFKIFGLSIYTSAIAIVLLTGLYTLIGGAKAVIRTNVFQSIMLIFGALTLTILGLSEIGGISALTNNLSNEYFTMFKPMSDPDFPWTGILFGAPIIAFWYWCTDQYIIQRLFSAKSLNDARRGSLLAALLKLLPIFILVLPGLIAVVMYPGIKGDDAYPTLLAGNLLPIGIKGLVLAGVLSAIMSSLSSVFNVAATLYTNDIYKPKHKDASEQKLVLVGRLVTIILIFLAILCVPLVRQIDSQIYLYLQTVQAYFGPPIAALFITGLLIKRINANGALWGLIVGESLGVFRLVTDFILNSGTGHNLVLRYFGNINFLHYAIIIFIISSLTTYIISLLASKATEREIPLINLSVKIPGIWDLDFGFSKLNILKADKVNLTLSVLIILVIFGVWSIWH